MDTNAPANVKLGWLWFDNDPKTSLEEKMDQAAARYRQRFGQAPRLCYVNQKALDNRPGITGRLRVEAASNVLPGHFLFVVEEAAAAGQRPPAGE